MRAYTHLKTHMKRQKVNQLKSHKLTELTMCPTLQSALLFAADMNRRQIVQKLQTSNSNKSETSVTRQVIQNYQR